MQGFAVIDNQPDSRTIAVWVTSHVSAQRADHSNAVVIDVAQDPEADSKLRSLTRSHVVLITEGSAVDSLPVDGKPLTVDDIDALVAETEEHQARILQAVKDYASQTRNKSLVLPRFPTSPLRGDFPLNKSTASHRAFQTANYLADAWTAWLVTDEQRRRRTVQPRSNRSPWIMPENMNSQQIDEFPPRFASGVQQQPLV